MPLYEFECPLGHKFEKLLSLSEKDTKEFLCEICKDVLKSNVIYMGERTWSIFNTCQIGKSILTFKNPNTGERQLALSQYQKPPKGFVKEEIKGSLERAKFTKEQNQLEHVRNEIILHERQQVVDQTSKNRHDDTLASLNSIKREIDPQSGKEVEFTLEESTKDLVKKAMKRSREKRLPPKRTEFRFDVDAKESQNLVDEL